MHVHRYIPPPDHPLAPYLQSIWRVHANGAYRAETILPKGNVDILFNLCQPLCVKLITDDGEPHVYSGAHVAGTQTQGVASAPQGEVLLLGVSFRAETCAALLPIPLHELTDQTLEAVHVFKDAEELRQRLGELSDFNAQVPLLLDRLMRRIGSHAHCQIIHHACDRLRRADAGAGITMVAREIGYSPRHLRRLFLQHVGVTPGHYLRLSRFIRSLHLMSSPASLTEIAHAASYFDQPHFCRDFREIAGITPGEYRQNVGPALGHLFHS